MCSSVFVPCFPARQSFHGMCWLLKDNDNNLRYIWIIHIHIYVRICRQRMRGLNGFIDETWRRAPDLRFVMKMKKNPTSRSRCRRYAMCRLFSIFYFLCLLVFVLVNVFRPTWGCWSIIFSSLWLCKKSILFFSFLENIKIWDFSIMCSFSIVWEVLRKLHSLLFLHIFCVDELRCIYCHLLSLRDPLGYLTLFWVFVVWSVLICCLRYVVICFVVLCCVVYKVCGNFLLFHIIPGDRCTN